MTIDGLLTLLGLLAAVFAVMSRAQRLNLWLKVRPVHVLAISVAFAAIVVLELYDWLFGNGWVPCLPLFLPKSNEIAFLVALGSVLLLVSWVHVGPLPKGKLRLFRDLIEELIKNEQYVEGIRLMEAHLDRLTQIRQQDFLFPRIRRWLESFDPVRPASIENILKRLNVLNDDTPSNARPTFARIVRTGVVNIFGRVAGNIGRLLPSGEGAKEQASEIFRLALLHPEFIRAVVRIRPYSGLRILALDIFERDDFSDEYFRQLMLDRTSVLYWEIKNNQNLSGQHRYAIPESNRLLWYVFHDVRNAESLGVWQPVGEEMIAELDRLYRSPETDHYNGALDDYRERGQWKCPFFMGIRFFDIMVSEAIDQNIQWHMWLYYFTHITDRICRNYRPDPEKVDLDAEFPTPYSSLLYEIVSTLRYWIRKVEDLPPEQKNTVLESTALIHENGNPVKSSILALGECLRSVLIAQHVPARLKHYLASIVFDLYFRLVRQDKLVRYAEVLRNTLLAGGLFERPGDEPEYLGSAIQGLMRNDNVPHRHEDVLELMRALVHRFIEKFEQARLADYVVVEPWEGSSIRLSSGNHAYIVEMLGNQ